MINTVFSTVAGAGCTAEAGVDIAAGIVVGTAAEAGVDIAAGIVVGTAAEAEHRQ